MYTPDNRAELAGKVLGSAIVGTYAAKQKVFEAKVSIVNTTV
jgi:hypothetical protein